jgi:hypothetical protein
MSPLNILPKIILKSPPLLNPKTPLAIRYNATEIFQRKTPIPAPDLAIKTSQNVI